MKIMNFKYVKLSAILISLGLMTLSCTQPESEENNESLDVKGLVFSSDFKSADLFVSARDGSDGVLYIDSLGTNVKVSEVLCNRMNLDSLGLMPMHVESVVNLTSEYFLKIGLKALVLVDLTLPQEAVDAECEAVRQIHNFICNDNLFISFLKSGGEITETELLTDYVLDNCFFADNGAGDKYLYEGIYRKILEFDRSDSPVGEAGAKVLFVMSDGAVWSETEAYDPNHFAVERELHEYAEKSKWDGCLIYSNFSHGESDDLFYDSTNATVLSFCNRMGGLYQSSFKWAECRNLFEKKFYLPSQEYFLSLSHHVGREYDGVPRRMIVEVSQEGDVPAMSGYAEYCLGNEFFPIIVHGANSRMVASQGVYLLAGILLLLFLVLQFIVPGVGYRSFRKKYVSEYTGSNMCLGGKEVADSCYLCKAPFKKGETIVSKCEHTMHFDCWEGNGYHCPEYSARCKTGSYYYNRSNIFDYKNAPYYAKWLYSAILAAMFGWFMFYFYKGSLPLYLNGILNSVVEKISVDTVMNLNNRDDGFIAYMSYLPTFSFFLAVPLVFMLSFLVDKERSRRDLLLSVALRTLAAALWTTVLFVLNSLFCIIVDNSFLEEIVELFTWLLYTHGISKCITFRSSAAKPDRKFHILLLAATMIIFGWPYSLFMIGGDYRLLICLCFLAYAVLVAFAVATVSPRSDHFVLYAEGSIKATSIALYKWFRANPDAVVKLGRSVDCNIQMSWDIQGDIAPIQAEIFMRNSRVYLRALERGVVVGSKRGLKPDETVRLYQRSRFTIGKTTFTYMETDI